MQIEIVESLLDITKPRWNSWIPDDYPFLYNLGVSKVFGPGTNIQEEAIEIIKLL